MMKDTLSIEVRDKVIEFNFHDVMKYSYNNVYSATCYDHMDEYVQKVLGFDCEDRLNVELSHDVDFTKIEEMERNIYVPQNVQ
jgi:hypothetical protein